MKNIFFIIIFLLKTEIIRAESKPILVRCVEAQEFNFFEKFKVSGKCEIIGKKKIYATVNGVVDFVTKKEGRFVKKGEIIIIIDELMANAIKNESEVSYKIAKKIYERNLELFSLGTISLDDLNNSELSFERANLAYNQALKIYNGMIIKASHDGNLSLVNKSIGDDVIPGEELFEIIPEADKIFLVDLPENFLTQKINRSSIEVFFVDENNKKLKAKNIVLANHISDNGTVKMRVTFSKELKIPDGAFLELQIIYNKHLGIAIPEKAILRNDKGSYIYIVSDDNKAKEIYIKTGVRHEKKIEVLYNENIKIGTKIITEGLNKISNGNSLVFQEAKN